VKIGYVAQNLSLDCTPSSTFRLASYSADRLRTVVASNLACLRRILEFNVAHGLLYYRISSDMVPFASHPICDLDWAGEFHDDFAALGVYVRDNGMRIAMHPGQYTLVNSPTETTWLSSVAELVYHATILDLMELDTSAKLQIHVGGVYGDKQASIARFSERFALLPQIVQRRLAIENDERLYGIPDCLMIAEAVGIPIIFDDFHFRLKDDGMRYEDVLQLVRRTWRSDDGPPLVDYSSQDANKRFGSHAASLDEADFAGFLDRIGTAEIDVMLEIKDKNHSALRALAILKARGLA
jgi:UV DNA damage endonuclease